MPVDIQLGAGAANSAESLTTPAGLQAISTLRLRRTIFLTLVAATCAAMVAAGAAILSAGGWSALDAIAITAFAVACPWPALGFWNACIGLWQLHLRRDGLHEVAPFLEAGDADTPLNIQTAVFMTIRNEDAGRAIGRLAVVKDSLDATGEGGRFHYFVLSDSDREDVAAAETAAVGAWQAHTLNPASVIYRRRDRNTGYKAGNVRDFVEAYGGRYELMLPLDADSIMTGEGVVRLVRIMQAYPKIGILQSLVVGTPSRSAFTRLFQFGMRFGMRAYTMGQAWWVGDCGPFWGHNAVVRVGPFADHCALPVLAGGPPLGGHVLSHDQVEAVLMRRAGFEVRVMPVEGGSYEDNPPDALAFIERDVRWCQGNMQYMKLLALPGLLPISRFQLLWAILMFVGVPAWVIMIVVAPLVAVDAHGIAEFPVAAAAGLYLVMLGMHLAPKIAGLVDATLTRGEVARFGGHVRFAISALLEVVFSFLQGSLSTIRTTLFMVGLPFGKSISWNAQRRDAAGVGWAQAARALWPQTLFGVGICLAMFAVSPTLLAWSLPLTAGYLLAVPFAVLTASPGLGRVMQRAGLAAVSEDFAPPPELARLAKPTAGM